MPERDVAGRPVLRDDGRAKVTGSAKYCIDLTAEGALHARAVRSERAHALIRQIYVDEALAMQGVEAVVTSSDLGPLFPRFGHIIADHPILASDRVRYWGEPIALVLAQTKALAADAASAVSVEYEDLPAVMSAAEAARPGAPELHQRTYEPGDSSFAVLTSDDHHQHHGMKSNICHSVDLAWGDVDAALADSPVVVESELFYPMLYAYAMETYNALARFENSTLHVESTAQHPYQVREDLARIFNLPLAQVQVTSPLLGGGYGSKSYTKVEPLAAVGAWVVQRPVKIVLDVEESIYTTRADAARIHVRSGFDEQGRIVARDFAIELDSGAYADNSPLVLAKAVNRCFGPYRIPNLRVRGTSYYTNTPPASSYRGFGAPQGALAGETNLDQAAERLGMDGLSIRLVNLVDRGEEVIRGKRPLDADLKADLGLVMRSLEGGKRETDGLYGIGFACTASDAGAFPISTAEVKILPDGSVVLLTGATEMGQGSRTVLRQIVAEELGVPYEAVTAVQSNTSATPYERTTGASRTTVLVGLAVQRACADAQRKIREMAAEVLDVPVSEIASCAGGVRAQDDRRLSLGAVVEGWFGSYAGEVVGHGIVRKRNDIELLPPFWEVGCVGVGVTIDPDTGVVTVDQLVTVGDVGFAVNPKGVEGQDLGAATQGLGAALYEELVFDGPHPVNPNIVDYRVPRITDMPRRIDTIIVERGDGIGPYGAKGGGEGALNPIAPAVAAAVARAVGCWPTRVPLTPERVWQLLQMNGSNGDQRAGTDRR